MSKHEDIEVWWAGRRYDDIDSYYTLTRRDARELTEEWDDLLRRHAEAERKWLAEKSRADRLQGEVEVLRDHVEKEQT